MYIASVLLSDNKLMILQCVIGYTRHIFHTLCYIRNTATIVIISIAIKHVLPVFCES